MISEVTSVRTRTFQAPNPFSTVSLKHPCIRYLPLKNIDWMIYYVFNLFMYLFLYSFNHLFVYLFSHSLIHLVICLFIYSFILLIDLFIYHILLWGWALPSYIHTSYMVLMIYIFLCHVMFKTLCGIALNIIRNSGSVFLHMYDWFIYMYYTHIDI